MRRKGLSVVALRVHARGTSISPHRLKRHVLRSPIHRTRRRQTVSMLLSLLIFLHSHGGIGCGSAHNPFSASRASASKPFSTASPGAYFRYHQHQPSFTNE